MADQRIKNNENSNELTNIRLYKTWVDTDVLEPRQHLAWQRYIEEKNSDGIGVAMCNARKEIQDHADFVTTRDHNHSGVAEAAQKYILEAK